MSAINCTANLSNKNLTQYAFDNNEKKLLQMPLDVLNKIMNHVCDEPSAMKSAIRAVEFGRVSALTHQMTHANSEIDSLIHDERKFVPFVKSLTEKLNLSFFPEDGAEMALLLNPKNRGLAETDLDIIFNDAELVRESARDLHKIFYATFKRSVESISNKEYLEFVGGNNWNFLELASKIFIVSPDSIFSRKIHQDLIKSFVSKPLENLTMESYKEFSETLNMAFGNIPPQDNDRILRQAICSTYEKEQLDALSEKYSNPSEDLLATIKEELKDDRNQRKNDIEKQIRELCGDNFNGAIDAAYRIMQTAEVEKNQAKATYLAGIQSQKEFTMNTNDTELVFNGYSVVEPFSMFMRKINAYQEARTEFDTYKARLDELAVWTNGVITSGAVIDIQAGLQGDKLDADAESKCIMRSAFYAQLSMPIDEDNKAELYDQLHQIIG